MTTPTPALSAESEAVVAFYEREDGLTPYQKALLVELLSAAERAVYEQGVGDGIAMEQGMQAEAVARHVRETGCEGLREALEESHRQWGAYGAHPGEAYRTLERAVRAHLAAPAASPEEG